MRQIRPAQTAELSDNTFIMKTARCCTLGGRPWG